MILTHPQDLVGQDGALRSQPCDCIPRGEEKRVKPAFFEFFAGGGMARAGLDPAWSCVFANDFDLKKSSSYRLNWGHGELLTADVRKVTLGDLPQITPDLVWASFPCQDLSLAGGGAGLRGDRSGTFWPFWALVKGLVQQGRSPTIIALENVCGTLTSHGGRDFSAIVGAFAALGYRAGALVVDAELFVPQSRPRLFFVGVKAERGVEATVIADAPTDIWHSPGLRRAHASLTDELKANWVWWTMDAPGKRNSGLSDIIEERPSGVEWHSSEETSRLLRMMSPLQQRKVFRASQSGERMVGAVYRRTRPGPDGEPVQRAEVRFDNVSGCLRTPAGGSSRQLLLVVEGQRVRSRLISARETARLMGLADSYKLPERYNEAYHLTGDGVVVPVVNHLSKYLLTPLLHHLQARWAA
jgi:DNA (cytosine-5)-methyltransferase 1